jgi:hypothetical protein
MINRKIDLKSDLSIEIYFKNRNQNRLIFKTIVILSNYLIEHKFSSNLLIEINEIHLQYSNILFLLNQIKFFFFEFFLNVRHL